jgi:hypothetical protein
MPLPPTSIESRFWPKVKKGDGCWLWQASLDRKGYGTIRRKDGESTLRAHRVSFEIAFGPIPAGMCVLHKCDTPRCVRPDHLRLGTFKDNSQDASAKGRLGRKLSAEKRVEAIWMFEQGVSRAVISETLDIQLMRLTKLLGDRVKRKAVSAGHLALSEDQLAQMVELRRQGCSYRTIGARMGFSRTTAEKRLKAGK